MTVSVVLAAFNGEKYIKEQIESILSQLREEDELLISDDGSNDNTIDIIKDCTYRYKNVKILKGPQKGYICNFQFLLSQATKDIVCISDQDDIWLPQKISEIKKAFAQNKEAWVILHNAEFINAEGCKLHEELFQIRQTRHGAIRNLIKSSYYGCCMALRREYVDFIIPFPMCKYNYDQWIGLFAELHRKSIYIDTPLIKHRLHGSNQSVKRDIIYKLKFRAYIILYILMLQIRLNERRI